MAAQVAMASVALSACALFRASAESPDHRGQDLPRDVRQNLDCFFGHDGKAFSVEDLPRRLGLTGTGAAQISTACNPSIIGTAGAYAFQAACSNYLWNASSGNIGSGGGTSSQWRANGNIDPIYGSQFPLAAVIPAATSDQLLPPVIQRPASGGTVPSSYTAQVGLQLAAQVGWGGGPNVTLGPPANSTVWGVHATPSTSDLASGQASVLISWLMGASMHNVSVRGVGFGSGGSAGAGGYSLVCPFSGTSCPLGMLQNTPAPGAFVPTGVNFSVSIMGGTDAGMLSSMTTKGLTCLQYIRVVSDSNYLSPYVCHVTVPNLKASTTYHYTITCTVSGTPVLGPTTGTYSMPSTTYSSVVKTFRLTTTSLASTGCPSSDSCNSIYPVNFAVMADVGQTFNSSLTAQYLSTYMSGTAVQAIFNMGDLTYSDNFGMDSTYYDGKSGTNPWKWDSWSAMWQPVTGQAMLVNAVGNHEIESLPGQSHSNVLPTDNSRSYGFLSADQRYPFQAYAARFPSGAQSTTSYGDLWKTLYYSQNLGPVHVITMSNYVPFVQGTEQYNWFVADISAVNRATQPWLIVQFHAPIYHSYLTHYKEAECFRATYESMFMQYNVDFVLSGHVHAYERTHPMYDYAPNACGPVWITIGDGGNIEGPYRNFMDEVIPGSTNVTMCQAASVSIKAGISMTNTWIPSYQKAAQPSSCTTLSFQPAQVGTEAGIIEDPNNVGSKKYWCQSTQPAWSAYRDPSFGFASLSFTSDNTASFSWYRSVDQNSVTTTAQTLKASDTSTYTRSARYAKSTCSTYIATVTTAAAGTTAAPGSAARSTVAGTMILSGITNVTDFIADSQVKAAIAKGIATSAGVDVSHIVVTLSLGSTPAAVLVTYVLTVWSITAIVSGLTAASLQTNIQTSLISASISATIAVSRVSVPVVTALTTAKPAIVSACNGLLSAQCVTIFLSWAAFRFEWQN